MSLTRLCLNNPAAIAVLLAVVALLGALSVERLPIQLFPNIERPTLGVWTGWRAASPREVEAEIIEPIERELRGAPGLRTMQSWSNTGGGFVHLEFALGTDMDKAFTEVTSRLQRVRGLPADADRPAITNNGGGGAGDTLIFLFLQRLPGASESGARLSEFARQRIAPELESIEGVAGVEVNSDDGEEIVRISFDPFLAAQYGITLDQISQAANRSSDVTGGSVEVGRRNYTMRFEGRFTADQLENAILAWRNGAPIRLGDIAEVAVGPDRAQGVVYQNGNPAIGMRVMRAPGANTLAAINAVTEKINELNAGPLAELGYAVHKSFDPSLFIKQALSLLTGNLLAGIVLAVGVLWLFIRRVAATLLIAAAIPICLAATIVFLNVAGRSINVISLAGLAFATGMVLDAAIVVMENFVRMREEGREPMRAAGEAVGQVFGALFASTVTTVAIFLPILFFEDVEGQLFADLALTIAVAVSFSLLAAVTVLPTGAAHLMKTRRSAPPASRRFVERVAGVVMAATATPRRRWAWIAGLTAAPIALGWLLFPSLNYLPPVKRAAIDGFISFPSGANADTMRKEFAEVVVERLDPYMKGEKEPALLNYYLYTGVWGGNIGVRAKDVAKLGALERIVNEEILAGFPDTRVFAERGNLFGGFGGGGGIRVELQAADYEALTEAAPAAIDVIQAALPGASVWPNPDPQVVNPEIRILPNDRRIAEAGFTRDSLARAVRAFGDGLWLGEFFHEDARLDIILQANGMTGPEHIETAPLATPGGAVVPLGELATIARGVGPQQIRRLDGRRAISLGINPPKGMALGDVVEALKENAEADLYRALPEGATVKYAGEADALARAVKNLGANFLLAVAILFLILSALFKSVRDAALVIVALPMAAVGGIVAVRLLNLVTPTPLDLLGMIGFIILLGLVVNNSILLVSQARACEREGLDRRAAVAEALRLRIRPIFLTTLTSIMGMLPLVVAPGAGSAIYRGLATVIVGGMAVSTLFTLVLLPSLLQIGAPARRRPLPAGALQPAE
ncbi:efflux RND transporter permease subunit [Amphiplicatus metriothermophilus]|uniref:Multidrug efflux pump subunit AcrB n=1 Tax=Amphiplicatus metriothermophilus TaxID=1519374 RepID=A0A239PJW8_9PROT|nr:efflux RND transporter permease subunit [Amphiplicatus metriothermophilus]MBB5518047.1 multidrug efflux pump subunit AcrB [Amphiplicatus metriothermophilus]SNT67619.1 Multidrug efflux pump subunit AcrB [Amphiplicatus metriothermophilus]